MIKLARYLKNYKAQVIIGPIFKLLEAIFELIVPLVMANIIDEGIKTGNTSFIASRGLLMVVLGVFGLAFALICQRSAAKASQGFATALRSDLFKHINTFSHKELDKLGASALTTRVINDINNMQVAVSMLIRLVVRAPFLVVGAIVMSMFLDLKLSIVFLVAAPLIGLILYYVMSRSAPMYKNIGARMDTLSRISQENLNGARVVRAFSKQEYEQSRFAQENASFARASINVGKIASLLNPLTMLVLNTAIICIIYFGGMRVNIGALSQGEIIAFVNYISQIMLSMTVIANLIVIFTKASASAVRINEVFDTQPSVTQKTGQEVSVKKDADAVAMEKVSFSYNGKNTLFNINLKIPKNKTIGIIGPTGSGKSTLLSLIPRFYDPLGSVKIFGVDAKEYPFAQLRGMVGYVAQKSTIFSGTVRENIAMGKAQDIAQAIDIAQAAEIVDRMPGGLDAQIFQAGKNLSGGQKQRLCIARALAQKPEILILDDSFSALDYATEAAIKGALARLENTTVIIASQRVSSIMHADYIYVLDEGRIAGQGSHAQLLASCELYKEIYYTQTRGSA